ncbi:MAG: hypothetical protein ACLS7Z_08300 [Christensenellales bacterium]
MNERAIVVCARMESGVTGWRLKAGGKYKWPTVLLAQDGDICVGSARRFPA